MKSNFNYVMENFEYGNNKVDWLYSIKAFFGDEQAEAFCEYLINARHIIRKDDIRNIIPHHSLSIYTKMNKEQLAFVSVYSPINTNSNLVKNTEDGYQRYQNFYRDRNVKLTKKIKNLGYSYVGLLGNWKDKNKKDTFQREYIFVIFSEKDSPEQFKNNIIKLLKDYNKSSVLITENILSDEPKLQIKSKIFDIETGNVIAENEDTSIEVVEKYFSNISNTRFYFKVPYERNKTILWLEDNPIGNYYSKDKQEKIKKTYPGSMNMGYFKQSLVNSFARENYNK